MKDVRTMITAELMATIMGCSIELASKLLQHYERDVVGMSNFLSFPNIEGMTWQKTLKLQAALELGRRIENAKKNRCDMIIKSSEDIFNVFNEDMSNIDHEELWALYMSGSGKILAKKRISSGTVNSSLVCVKTTVLPAIETKASLVALVHNHPHASLNPSQADKNVTKDIKEALKMFETRLIDHLIISDGNYYSFNDNGLI